MLGSVPQGVARARQRWQLGGPNFPWGWRRIENLAHETTQAIMVTFRGTIGWRADAACHTSTSRAIDVTHYATLNTTNSRAGGHASSTIMLPNNTVVRAGGSLAQSRKSFTIDIVFLKNNQTTTVESIFATRRVRTRWIVRASSLSAP